jgi:hypothetical protein
MQAAAYFLPVPVSQSEDTGGSPLVIVIRDVGREVQLREHAIDNNSGTRKSKTQTHYGLFRPGKSEASTVTSARSPILPFSLVLQLLLTVQLAMRYANLDSQRDKKFPDINSTALSTQTYEVAYTIMGPYRHKRRWIGVFAVFNTAQHFCIPHDEEC